MHGMTGFITTILVRLLEVVFALGAIGSIVVIILASVEDARTLKHGE